MAPEMVRVEEDGVIVEVHFPVVDHEDDCKICDFDYEPWPCTTARVGDGEWYFNQATEVYDEL